MDLGEYGYNCAVVKTFVHIAQKARLCKRENFRCDIDGYLCIIADFKVLPIAQKEVVKFVHIVQLGIVRQYSKLSDNSFERVFAPKLKNFFFLVTKIPTEKIYFQLLPW
jgi:hypothetical protein